MKAVVSALIKKMFVRGRRLSWKCMVLILIFISFVPHSYLFWNSEWNNVLETGNSGICFGDTQGMGLAVVFQKVLCVHMKANGAAVTIPWFRKTNRLMLVPVGSYMRTNMKIWIFVCAPVYGSQKTATWLVAALLLCNHVTSCGYIMCTTSAPLFRGFLSFFHRKKLIPLISNQMKGSTASLLAFSTLALMPTAIAKDGRDDDNPPSDKVNPVFVQDAKSSNVNVPGGGGYTLSQVQSSKSLAVINGKVVDLSSWVSQHPGGAAAIQDCEWFIFI